MKQTNKPILKRWAWGLGFLGIFLTLAWKLENLATLVLLSFIVAYVLNPLVTRLSKLRFFGRTSATVITMVGLLIGFITVLFFIIPEVISEFNSFLGRLPQLAQKLQETVVPKAEELFGITIPKSWNEAYEQLIVQIESDGSKYVAPAAEVAKTVFGTTFSAVFALIGAFMFPLFLFFLLQDFPRIITTIDNLVPIRNRPTIRSIAKDVDTSLSAFLHGQFTVMLVLGTLYSIGYSIVGIPVAVGVGLLTGLLCFIPYIGAATGFVLALLMAILEMKGWTSIAGVVGVFVTVQLLDAVLITPRILGGKLGLQPLWIIIALMAGGELFGFLGVLLAVPTTAVLKIVVIYTIDHYKKSSIYNTQDIDKSTLDLPPCEEEESDEMPTDNNSPPAKVPSASLPPTNETDDDIKP